MNFESNISEYLKDFFFREFTYSKANFNDIDNQKKEVADNIFSLDNLKIIFQLKERNINASSDENDLIKWFDKKVIKKASSQMKDSTRFLTNNKIKLINKRGHEIELQISSNYIVNKVILYKANKYLPDSKKQKYYNSSTIGIIHIIEDIE